MRLALQGICKAFRKINYNVYLRLNNRSLMVWAFLIKNSLRGKLYSVFRVHLWIFRHARICAPCSTVWGYSQHGVSNYLAFNAPGSSLLDEARPDEESNDLHKQRLLCRDVRWNHSAQLDQGHDLLLPAW